MRSDKIHRALAQGMNRFEMCQLVAKGVKATHKTGGSFEDTINNALDFLGPHESDQEVTCGPHASQFRARGQNPETGCIRLRVTNAQSHTHKNEKDGRYAVLFNPV